MVKPVLYVFAISHYCEKARWALDLLGIEYELKHLPPGVHRRVAKKLGALRSSLPILQAGDQIIQGSSAIINWAEAHKAANAPSLSTDDDNQLDLEGMDILHGNEIEKRLDAILGVHIRRYYYSEALVDHPHTVRPIFVRDLQPFQQVLTNLMWGAIRNRMIKGMDLGSAQGLESRQIIEIELNWLDQLLENKRQYLIGNHVTRVDITAASLLAPLILPPEHPTYMDIKHSPNVSIDCQAWQQRPSLQWAREVYKKWRVH